MYLSSQSFSVCQPNSRVRLQRQLPCYFFPQLCGVLPPLPPLDFHVCPGSLWHLKNTAVTGGSQPHASRHNHIVLASTGCRISRDVECYGPPAQEPALMGVGIPRQTFVSPSVCLPFFNDARTHNFTSACGYLYKDHHPQLLP